MRRLVVVVAVSAALVLAVSCADTPVQTDSLASAPPPEIGGLAIGPIPGLTQNWHTASDDVVFPRDVTVRLACPLLPGESIRWVGAEEIATLNSFSIAECSNVQPGVMSVSVLDDQSRTMVEMSWRVLDVDVADIRLGVPELTVDPVQIGGKGDAYPDIQDSANELTMDYFFSEESIADLVETEEGHYVTSVKRTVFGKVEVVPSDFATMVEWRTPDGASLGSSIPLRCESVGTSAIRVGPAEREQKLRLTLYETFIEHGTMGEEPIVDGFEYILTARTVPEGFESQVVWLASTKYGYTDNVTGRGESFSVAFFGTDGPTEDDLVSFQWTGIAASDDRLNMDHKVTNMMETSEANLLEGIDPALVDYCTYVISSHNCTGFDNPASICVPCVGSCSGTRFFRLYDSNCDYKCNGRWNKQQDTCSSCLSGGTIVPWTPKSTLPGG